MDVIVYDALQGCPKLCAFNTQPEYAHRVQLAAFRQDPTVH